MDMRKQICILLLALLPAFCHAQEPVVKLWDKGGQGRGKVTLTAYLPAKADVPATPVDPTAAATATPSPTATPATAVIVCPGGSYFWLDRQKEGHDVARWLQGSGIAAFVLEYRTAGKFNYPFGTRLLYGGNRFPRMLQDVQMAILHLRENAAVYGITPARIGVMGFSAGGHLAMLSAERCSWEYLRQAGVRTGIKTDVQPGAGDSTSAPSLRPDFIASIYPVVTMADRKIVHKRSHRALLGEWKMLDRALRDSLSLERHVPDACPPVFLLNCADDPVVDPRNSELLDSALTRRQVPHLYIRYPVGGHGFGCGEIRDGDRVYDWKPAFLEWLGTAF